MKQKQENIETRNLIKHAFEMARTLSVQKLLVQADELTDIKLMEQFREEEQIIWLSRENETISLHKPKTDKVVSIPQGTLSRMSQLKVGLLLAVMHKFVDLDESLLCLSGVAGTERLDTMMIANAKRDFPWFQKYKVEDVIGSVKIQEFVQVLQIALRLAREGREGHSIGTLLLLGDTEKLEPYLKQLVLNPCAGHPQKLRNIHDEEFFETIREFASLDGAFVINNRGVVESAGTYIDAPVAKIALKSGLGARHSAGASITETLDVIAVAVSSSSGTVTVFHEGKAILELEKTNVN
jgi:diadenylate cyclase